MNIFVKLNAITLFAADQASVLHAYNKYHEMVSVFTQLLLNVRNTM